MPASRFPIWSLASALVATSLAAQTTQLSLNSADGADWRIHAQVGASVTLAGLHQPAADLSGWVPASVPGTVFGSFVAAGLEPNPNYADNILRVAPAKYEQDYWYRVEFAVPAGLSRGRLWLNFLGVNRDAEVFLNGLRLGQIQGIVQRGRFDITAVARSTGANVLAVLVHPPLSPVSNGASPTYGSSGGWDWMPRVPGFNSGIQDDVFITTTGEVSIIDPWIQADLPRLDLAQLKLQVELLNSSNRQIQGRLVGRIDPGAVSFELPVTLGPREKKPFTIDHQGFPELAIANPDLWWPNGYGAPKLYHCELRFVSDGAAPSDIQVVPFGIRRLEVDTSTRAMRIIVNGVPIFVAGGNWGMPEYLLRGSAADYETRVRLHQDMNFNMIRNWMGSTTNDAFYTACDRHGILVWDDFWLNSSGGLPRDLLVFHANSIEKLKRLRNHPCIALWCGSNEGVPPAPLDEWLATNVRTFDGRHYHSNSHSASLSGSGPWTGLAPEEYFLHAAPGNWGGEDGWGMRSEMGAAAFVNVDSLKEFIPADKLWPRNETWNTHFFGPSAMYAGPDTYAKAIDDRYGTPKGIEEFCRKAQLLNLETYKAMFEGLRDNLWHDATGLLIWMSQSAFPSMVWQTYDYYFDATGAYWGAKSACEPVHIQWNPGTNSVKAINNTRTVLTGVRAEARVYGLDGVELAQMRRSRTLDLAANEATACFAAPPTGGDLARGRPVTVSSVHVPGREGDKLTDGREDTRWESDFSDQPWLMVDLGEPEPIGRVIMRWEPGVYARIYKLQASDDAIIWRDAFYQKDGKGGTEEVSFPTVTTRYLRMFCQEKATTIGISMRAFEVYADAASVPPGVHFLRLRLTAADGKLLSENLYWRGARALDYKELDSLPPVALETKVTRSEAGGQQVLTAQVSNPNPAAAFAIRVQVVDARTDRRILPIFANDSYFTLMRGESRTITVQFNGTNEQAKNARLVLTPFNARR